MKSILLSVLLCGVAYCEKVSVINLSAADPNHHIGIGERYFSEIKCIKKLDAILKSRWTDELNGIPTGDLENLVQIPWEDRESQYTKYNSLEDEWLMEGGSPTRKINECVRSVLSDIPATHLGHLTCLAELLSINSEEEIYHQRDFDNLVNISSATQLPLRKFISFPEIVQLIFQNRDPGTWTSLETLLYAHTKGYVLTDADESRRTYFGSQNCDWIDAVALREAPTETARLNRFATQVLGTVDKQLAGKLVKSWNLNRILPKDRHELWLKSRQEMTSKLEEEIETLRNQSKDPQWLCEYASELATNFADAQSSILLTEGISSVHLEASDIASLARTIEMILAKSNDSRQAVMGKIADKQDEGTRCLSSLVRMVENHRRYEIASVFVGEKYEFPEIYCENNIKNPGLNRFTFCNCIGSFCVAHSLAALFAEEYALVKGSDGLYKVVRSGVKSQRKVNHCHTLSNSSRNL